jgi:hypothetical protein
MLSFVDFAYITEIENYSDLDDQSFHNKINTDFNWQFEGTNDFDGSHQLYPYVWTTNRQTCI